MVLFDWLVGYGVDWGWLLWCGARIQWWKTATTKQSGEKKKKKVRIKAERW